MREDGNRHQLQKRISRSIINHVMEGNKYRVKLRPACYQDSSTMKTYIQGFHLFQYF